MLSLTFTDDVITVWLLFSLPVPNVKCNLPLSEPADWLNTVTENGKEDGWFLKVNCCLLNGFWTSTIYGSNCWALFSIIVFLFVVVKDWLVGNLIHIDTPHGLNVPKLIGSVLAGTAISESAFNLTPYPLAVIWPVVSIPLHTSNPFTSIGVLNGESSTPLLYVLPNTPSLNPK